MKKKLFAFSTLLLAATTVSAQQNVMRVHGTDGSVTIFNVNDVDYVDFEEVAAEEEVTPNLGGASNSYIVTAAGDYYFATTHVDGTSIDGIDHADWLWTENNHGELISNVRYEDGLIHFTASEHKGNAVIAAANAEGTILWIWHIWLTDRPEDKMLNQTVIMDRNLGAVSASPSDGRDTWGLVYQYGRNVPFYYIGDGQEFYPNEAMNQARKFTDVNPVWGDMDWVVSSGERLAGYTIEESMANPMTHMLHKYTSGSIGGYHWAKDSKVKTYVWGNQAITTKTIYDPCPVGYKVPFAEQLDFSTITYDVNDDFDSAHPIPGFYLGDGDDRQWWPNNCGRHYEDGCALYGGYAEGYPDRLFMWTAFAGTYKDVLNTTYTYMPLRVTIANNYDSDPGFNIYNPAMGAGAFGHTIRCVREESNATYAKRYVPEMPASDFTLTLADGTATSLLSETGKREYTILYFNNPDCQACVNIKADMVGSGIVKDAIADNRLSIVSVFTDEDVEMWRSHLDDYPAEWTVAIDKDQQVFRKGLYDMSRTPSLYLIDSNNRIVLADTDLGTIEQVIK